MHTDADIDIHIDIDIDVVRVMVPDAVIDFVGDVRHR